MRNGRPSWTAAHDADLLGLYVKGKPLVEYAAELNVAEPTVARGMRRLGLEMLPRGRPKGSRDKMERAPRRTGS